MIRFANLSPMQRVILIFKLYSTGTLLGLLFGFLSHSVQAQRAFSELNIENHFDISSDVNVDHRVFFLEDTIRIYIQLRINEPDGISNIFSLYNISWYVQRDYNEPDVLSENKLTAENLFGHTGTKWYFHLSLPANQKGNLLVLSVHKKADDKKYFYDISLDNTLNYSNAGLVLYPGKGDFPLLTTFVNNTDTFRIKSITNYHGPLYAYYYDKVFGPAKPPMVTEKRKVVKELELKDLIKIQPDQIVRFSRTGFYFIQKDTSSLDGITIRVEDPYFPLFMTMDKIILPLIYISTGSETKTIREARDQQGAFEDYWLKLSETPALAKTTIKKFYQHVEASNFYFTNYKEGWKTDPGMIYLVYGKPDEVYKGRETMDWIYNRNLSLPIIRFTFIKVKNIFADDHYSLMRKKNYDRIWYKSVELWRKGKK